MIIDSHAHIFPFLGAAPGYEHLAYLQMGISGNRQPVRRTHDNAVVPHVIWDAHDRSPSGRKAVAFRVGLFGRFEWTLDGVDYYKQFMPPSLADNSYAADALIAELDYADVEVAVLQNDHFYGALNELFAEAVRRYPNRLIATAHIAESRADQPEQQALLEQAVAAGHRGIFFHKRDFWEGDDRPIDGPGFATFWALVERLGLVVYWAPGGAIAAGLDGYLAELRRWRRIVERHPQLRAVLVGGLREAVLDAHPTRLPEDAQALLASGHLLAELLFPISYGATDDYPYRRAIERVRQLYELCGPDALVWGSDIPNVLRHCTYAQSLAYLRMHADFIPPDDLKLMLGGNLARIFKLEPASGA
jgi:predicted TIM-barrel fold metal-dependent hydrolase